jgi:phosphoribosylanthranilate isomerase
MGASVAVKICGLTRPDDAAHAAIHGARYAGVIMAGGPRHLSTSDAQSVLHAAAGARRVVVFGDQSPDEIVRTADQLSLDAVQLHGDASPALLEWLRARTPAARWAVVRVDGSRWPLAEIEAASASADALVLDAKVDGQLGGTGIALPWADLSVSVASWRDRHPAVALVLAGGLRADRVSEARRWLSPDVLDVSSGVERAPGIKEPALVRAFLEAAESGDD